MVQTQRGTLCVYLAVSATVLTAGCSMTEFDSFTTVKGT